MNLASRLQVALLLAGGFLASFLTLFLLVFFTQSAPSTPLNYVSTLNGMEFTLGTPPNSTNIPLDTTITVDAVASAALEDLRLTPDLPIARVYSEVTIPLTYLN